MAHHQPAQGMSYVGATLPLFLVRASEPVITLPVSMHQHKLVLAFIMSLIFTSHRFRHDLDIKFNFSHCSIISSLLVTVVDIGFK